MAYSDTLANMIASARANTHFQTPPEPRLYSGINIGSYKGPSGLSNLAGLGILEGIKTGKKAYVDPWVQAQQHKYLLENDPAAVQAQIDAQREIMSKLPLETQEIIKSQPGYQQKLELFEKVRPGSTYIEPATEGRPERRALGIPVAPIPQQAAENLARTYTENPELATKLSLAPQVRELGEAEQAITQARVGIPAQARRAGAEADLYQVKTELAPKEFGLEEQKAGLEKKKLGGPEEVGSEQWKNKNLIDIEKERNRIMANRENLSLRLEAEKEIARRVSEADKELSSYRKAYLGKLMDPMTQGAEKLSLIVDNANATSSFLGIMRGAYGIGMVEDAKSMTTAQTTFNELLRAFDIISDEPDTRQKFEKLVQIRDAWRGVRANLRYTYQKGPKKREIFDATPDQTQKALEAREVQLNINAKKHADYLRLSLPGRVYKSTKDWFKSIGQEQGATGIGY